MELSATLTPLTTPVSSLDPAADQFSRPKTYTLVISSAALEIQSFQDLAELNNQVVTLAKHFNMPIADLLRGGHLAVFEGTPSKLSEPPPLSEVLRVG